VRVCCGVAFSWDDLRYVLAVSRAGTLKAAGAALKTDPTTVGRRITQLETHLRTRLFERRPEGYVPTASGTHLAGVAERFELELRDAERNHAGDRQKLAGLVRITSTEMLTTRFIAPYLSRFSERYPDITLSLHCGGELLNLARGEADVALRLAPPREEALVGRHLADIELGLYAAPSYLAARGHTPTDDASLAGERVLAFADLPPFGRENRWIETHRDGAQIALRSNSVSTLYAAASAGLGVALLPCIVADRDPALARYSLARGPEPRAVWQAVHRDLARTARVRAVLDFVSGVLAPRRAGA
jgi:DNA-binding transcriptional LysR family regulator